MGAETKRILIITGEASGDLHGAHLAQALKALDPSLSILGVGGARMRAAGRDGRGVPPSFWARLPPATYSMEKYDRPSCSPTS